MTRTPLAGALAGLVGDVAQEEGPLPRITRRGFLVGAAATAVAAAMGPLPARAAAPRIVVVGAGLAGLTCAHQLVSSGVEVTVHEAGTRVGGRCWTRRGDFASGQIAEHGGELIDQSHTAIRQLAQSLGLDLDNLLAAEVNGTEQFNWMGGGPYTYEEATSDMKEIWQQLHRDVSAASYPTLFDSSTPRGRELDRMSIVDWIERYVPGGRRSRLGSLLEVAYTIEYGGEASEQSSLNMLYLLAYIGQGQMRILGPSNEKYHVRGGNDQITDRLAAALARSRPARLAARVDRTRGGRHLDARLRAGHEARERAGGPGRDDDPVLDPAHAGLLEGRLLGAQGAGDPRARRRHERQVPPPVHGPDLGRAGQVRRDVLRPRLPEHVGGDARAAGARGHPRRLHRRPATATRSGRDRWRTTPRCSSSRSTR